jgi:hypothetical protein
VDWHLKYPSWQEPVAAAILEFKPEQFLAKAQRAEEAISARLQELTFEESNKEELRLLNDSLSIIRGIKLDRLNFL